MKRITSSLLSLLAVGMLAAGALALTSTNATAVDNPCDPTYGMIKWCKSQHGRWDSSCCCCRLH